MNSEKQNLRPVFNDQVNTMVNLLKPYTSSTEEHETSDDGSINPIRNSDGSISLSGETLDVGITIPAGTANLQTGKAYCLCGTPGQGVNLQIVIDGKTYTDNGTGTTFSVGSGGYFDVNVVIDPHTQMDKLTIYPIVTRNMQAKLGDFVPYISDTDQINVQVAELSGRLTKVEDRLKSSDNTDTYNIPAIDGMTYTPPADGYILVGGGCAITLFNANLRIDSTSSLNNALFIRKGMTLKRVGSSGLCRFIGLA